MAKKKIVLGERPGSFTRAVEVPMLDGTTGTIECQFRYRDRKEFGALLDRVFAQPSPNLMKDGVMSSELQQQEACRVNGGYLHEILTGWNLDVPFSLEACVELATDLPRAATTIMDAYREGIVEGRLGN